MRPTHRLVRWLFLRAVGLVYLCAFLSLWAQVQGLIGSRGILPASELLGWLRGQTGAERYWLLPTLCWLSASDAFLSFLCWGGALLAVLLVLGVAPAPVLALLWAFYLSLSSVGQVFLQYQWDALLLEAGLLAVFFAPPGLRPRLATERPPSAAALWLLRWLLFRLILSSGAVKLLSGDTAWRSLTALDYHFWTQPLPTWIGWYAHQLPGWFQKASVALTFVVELVVPVLIFGVRPLRHVAFAAFVGLQLLIAATGNYAFFNLLTIALCLTLLDDAALPRKVRDALLPAGPAQPERSVSPLRRLALVPVVALIGLVSSMQMLGTLGLRLPWPAPAVAVYRAVAPLSSINGYGLFAVMTTERHEIVIEGTSDGSTWLPYGFKWKPGDATRAPAFVAPHQPRVDWQMWFAALGTCEGNPWLIRMMLRLQEGSPDILGLLGANPFPDAPPKQVRAVLWDYHFTDFDTRRATGAWWRREPLGPYCPVLGVLLPGSRGGADNGGSRPSSHVAEPAPRLPQSPSPDVGRDQGGGASGSLCVDFPPPTWGGIGWGVDKEVP